jgi:hypothetical protein
METRRENYRYDASGLSGIVLHGVQVSRCPQCGAEEVTIPRIEELHRVIARALIGKPTQLAAREIRIFESTSAGPVRTSLATWARLGRQSPGGKADPRRWGRLQIVCFAFSSPTVNPSWTTPRRRLPESKSDQLHRDPRSLG